MDAAYVTTPFGRRAMTLALLAKHKQAESATPDIKRNKWKLFRAVCEARADLDVSDRSLTVLDALLSFYPFDELSALNNLIVFPSNAQLSIRARGMTAATLRRHLAALVDAGLILRKDSPNGKRYARRGRTGDISEAFGFSLAPLLCRAKEIEGIASRISADRELLHSTREKISLCRREVTKLIQAAKDSKVEGEWNELYDHFRSLLESLPRRPSLDQLQVVLTRLTQVRVGIIKLLEEQDKSRNSCGNESQNERHIQDSQTNSQFESENVPRIAEALASENSYAMSDIDDHDNEPQSTSHKALTQSSITLDTVLQACPEIVHYAPDGAIRTWRDLLSASAVVRQMLQISTSAFQDACRIMGPENAAIAIACIYERGGAIKSAGAYLRHLSIRAAQRQFTVVPMLTALLRIRLSKN